MNWDLQTIIYVGFNSTTVLIALIVLAIVSRRLRLVMSELDSVRRELKMVDESVDALTGRLTTGSTER